MLDCLLPHSLLTEHSILPRLRVLDSLEGFLCTAVAPSRIIASILVVDLLENLFPIGFPTMLTVVVRVGGRSCLMLHCDHCEDVRVIKVLLYLHLTRG